MFITFGFHNNWHGRHSGVKCYNGYSAQHFKDSKKLTILNGDVTAVPHSIKDILLRGWIGGIGQRREGKAGKVGRWGKLNHLERHYGGVIVVVERKKDEWLLEPPTAINKGFPTMIDSAHMRAIPTSLDVLHPGMSRSRRNQSPPEHIRYPLF